MNKLRKILFPLFVIIYLTCCPLLIMHALGIMFAPAAKRTLIHTGVISLDSFPAGAEVEFNHQHWDEKTPTVIRSLRDGQYPVKLSLKGFRNWEHLLVVQPAKATSIEDILLIPEPWVIKTLVTNPTKDLIPFEGESLILLKNADRLDSLFIYRWPEGIEDSLPINVGNIPFHTPVSLMPDLAPLAHAEILSIKTSLQNPQFLIQIKNDGIEKFLFFDPKEGNIRQQDISDLLSSKATNIHWNGPKVTDLYFQEGRDLNRINLEARGIFPKIAQNILGFGLSNKKIYTLTSETVNILDAEGKIQQTIQHPSAFRQELNPNQSSYTVYPFNDMVLSFLNDQGQLLINRPPYLILEKGVLGLRFQPKTKQILFWTAHRIGIMDFSQIIDENGAPVCTLVWPVDHARHIQQVFFVEDGTHLLYRDGAALKLTSLNPNLNFATEDLFEIAAQTEMNYSDKSGELFYIDPSSHLLSKVTLHSGRNPQSQKDDKEKKDPPHAL